MTISSFASFSTRRTQRSIVFFLVTFFMAFMGLAMRFMGFLKDDVGNGLVVFTGPGLGLALGDLDCAITETPFLGGGGIFGDETAFGDFGPICNSIK